MGYDTTQDICGHGFRTLACSALIESGLWSEDAVELQMSHKESNSVRAAYPHKVKNLEHQKQWYGQLVWACLQKMATSHSQGCPLIDIEYFAYKPPM